MRSSIQKLFVNNIVSFTIILFSCSTLTFANDLRKTETKSMISLSKTEDCTAIKKFPDNNYEKSLIIENWMLDIKAFIPDTNESELLIENWMLNPNSFMSKNQKHPILSLE